MSLLYQLIVKPAIRATMKTINDLDGTKDYKQYIVELLNSNDMAYFCEFGNKTLITSWQFGSISIKMKTADNKIINRSYTSYSNGNNGWHIEKR